MQTSVLGLQFTVKPKHFKRGDMKLKCSATIATVYQRSNEESVEGERPQRASVLESRGTVAPAGSRADRVQGMLYRSIHKYFETKKIRLSSLPPFNTCANKYLME